MLLFFLFSAHGPNTKESSNVLINSLCYSRTEVQKIKTAERRLLQRTGPANAQQHVVEQANDAEPANGIENADAQAAGPANADPQGNRPAIDRRDQIVGDLSDSDEDRAQANAPQDAAERKCYISDLSTTFSFIPYHSNHDNTDWR